VKITIDTAAIAHRIRRRWWKLMRTPKRLTQCYDCGVGLTDDERTYYGWNCEQCEGYNVDNYGEFDARRMKRWIEDLRSR
jgi:ribosomal protein L37AE/L43A